MFRAAEIEFASDFPPDEAVRRLQDAMGQAPRAAPGRGSLAGSVTDARVLLWRVIPHWQNSFKPCFRGSFVDSGDSVVLRGRFGMPVVAKVFVGLWFGALGLGAVLVLRGEGRSFPLERGLLLPFGAMAALGAGVVGLGVWFARGDVAWLSAAIRSALSRAEPRDADR